MRNRLVLVSLVLATIVATGAVRMLGPSTAGAVQSAQEAQVGTPTLEWLGWSHFRITSSDGTVILINPFITGNPDASVTLDDINEADIILTADGHGDELGDTIPIAQKTGAMVLPGGFELGSWLIQKGVPASQVIRTNPGNRHQFGGITVRVVNSVHGSGLPEPTIDNPYGGPAAGFFVTLENGFTIYFAGSTAATMDMKLWGSAFKPDLAILPLNNDRDPLDVAQMARLLRADNPNLTRIMPHHHRVEQPAGKTTIAQLEEAIRLMDLPVTVVTPQLNQVMPLAK